MNTIVAKAELHSSRGFTLMELLVYIAIVGIVVLIAGQAFSDSTKIRVRTQSMLKASEVAENLGGLIKDDIAQMGAKSSKEASSSEMDDFQIFSSVYIDAGNSNEHKKDSSSFTLTNQSVNCPAEGCNVQKFVFNRVHYGENGEYVSLEEVTWKLVDGVLYRGCRTKAAGSAGASVDCPVADEDDMEFVEMAAGVDAFRLIPAKPPLLSTDAKLASDMTSILPSTDPTIKEFRLVPRYGDEDLSFIAVSPTTGGEYVELSGFASNYDVENNRPSSEGKHANQVFVAQANGTMGNWKALCKQVTLEPDVEYEISFAIPYKENSSRLFCPGRDYAAVGFRDLNGKKNIELEDFTFYMPASETESAVRTIRFSVKNQVPNVCMAFTFASYSPVASTAKMTIQNVTLKKVEFSHYDFTDRDYIPRVEDKKNVKAFRAEIVVKKNGESGESVQIIPVPSNGPRS